MSQTVDHVELDREAFRRNVRLKALRVPARQSQELRRLAMPHLLSIGRVVPVQRDASEETRLILLDEDVVENVPHSIRQLAERDDVEMVDYDLTVGYDRLSAAEVIRKLLPENVIAPSAFESVGHIAHLNLRPEHEPYKHAIGQVLLDKNPSIATVLNKVGTLENAFRVMKYEILAGNASLETEVRQNGCRFQLDFGKVYWNSRLEREHAYLVNAFRPEETILDLMAGIGPFAIPAAQKGCRVVANDLNPESYRYLRRNIALNGVLDAVLPLNLDARYGLRVVLGHEGDLEKFLAENHLADVAAFRERREKKRRKIEKRQAVEAVPVVPVVPLLPVRFQHVIMNYPQNAIGFLDMFRGLFSSEHWTPEDMPIVHCYAFKRMDETVDDMRRRCEDVLGAEIVAEMRVVRDVAPSKVMCCIRFQLPYSVATSSARLETDADSQHEKSGTANRGSHDDVAT